VGVLLDQLSRHRPGGAIFAGRLEWVSYIPRLIRFCGCCGYSEQMGRANQVDRAAHDGGCAAPDIPVDARATVVGPFVYANGPFYALSRPLVTRLLPAAARLVEQLGDDKWVPCSCKWECAKYNGGVREDPRRLDRFERHEDLTVGHAIAGLRGGAAVTFAQWGRTVFNDLDVANGPQGYFAIERKCLGELGVAAEGELATGTPSGWGTPETFGPMTAVVHRVKGEAQWRRVWAMEAEWTRRIATRGDPACAHPQATIEWRRNGTQSVEVELPFLR